MRGLVDMRNIETNRDDGAADSENWQCEGGLLLDTHSAMEKARANAPPFDPYLF